MIEFVQGLPTFWQVVLALMAYAIGGGITMGIVTVVLDDDIVDEEIAIPITLIWPATLMFMLGLGVARGTAWSIRSVVKALTRRDPDIPKAKAL